MITNILVSLFLFRSVSLYLHNRYFFYPLYFVLMGLFVVIYVGIFGALADKELNLIQIPDKSTGKKGKNVIHPFVLEYFLVTNVTMTSICVTGLLCFVIWVTRGVSAAIPQKIVPLLKDVDEIGKKLWIHVEDLRFCSLPDSDVHENV